MDISMFPDIKVAKAIQGHVQGKCYLCGDVFEGLILTHNLPPIISLPDDVDKYDVQPKVKKYGANVLAFQCFKCHFYICSNCIPKLKTLLVKKWGLLSGPVGEQGHKYGIPKCPKCGKNNFIRNIIIAGRFPPEVITSTKNIDRFAHFEYRFKVEIPDFAATVSTPGNICALCLSNSANLITETQYEGLGNKRVYHTIHYALCEPCRAILTDVANLINPGFPIYHHLKESILTAAKNKLQIWFVNPDYGAIWLKQNPIFKAVEFVPIAPEK